MTWQQKDDLHIHAHLPLFLFLPFQSQHINAGFKKEPVGVLLKLLAFFSMSHSPSEVHKYTQLGLCLHICLKTVNILTLNYVAKIMAHEASVFILQVLL